MNAQEDGEGPAMVPAYSVEQGIIVLNTPAHDQLQWTKRRLRKECWSVIVQAGEHVDIQEDRMIYALAGKVFILSAPKPLGGKPSPGFKKFRGETAAELMTWMLDHAVEPPLSGRGRKKIAPGTILKFIIDQANEVFQLKRSQEKDLLDDIVLRGMCRSGHLPDTGGRIIIPRYLRDRSLLQVTNTTAQAGPNITVSVNPSQGLKRQHGESSNQSSKRTKV
ncbi:hypothetical protein HDU97_003919 [Phlyctochytrium planicorne]|nr:hypothetical protein HDU97_003919 [Phlyctochytrium planicorne]